MVPIGHDPLEGADNVDDFDPVASGMSDRLV